MRSFLWKRSQYDSSYSGSYHHLCWRYTRVESVTLMRFGGCLWHPPIYYLYKMSKQMLITGITVEQQMKVAKEILENEIIPRENAYWEQKKIEEKETQTKHPQLQNG